MDDSAPSEREIPKDIESYKNNSDWYITRYTWQEYESDIAGNPVSIEDVLAIVGGEKQSTVKATPDYADYAYYVYIRVVALDNSGVSQSKQSVYAFFCIEFSFCVVRETSVWSLKQHVRILWNYVLACAVVWYDISYRLYSTRSFNIRLRVDTCYCCCCGCCSRHLTDNYYHCHCC